MTSTDRRVLWVERRFDFGFPAGQWREILERLRGTPARTEDRVAPLPTDLLLRRRGARWSIQEHVGHLVDLEELFLGRLDDYDADVGTLRAADMSNRKTHEAGYNDRPIVTVLAALRHARTGLIRRLEALPPERFAQSARHPRLDVPMRIVDMMYFHAEHDDYHLARMTELMTA